MDEKIKDLCRRLRLPGIYQSYHAIAEDFTNPEEFLVRILNAEVQSRETSRRERVIQQAGFPAYKRFEEINLVYWELNTTGRNGNRKINDGSDIDIILLSMT